jgi:hypothetical protein
MSFDGREKWPKVTPAWRMHLGRRYKISDEVSGSWHLSKCEWNLSSRREQPVGLALLVAWQVTPSSGPRKQTPPPASTKEEREGKGLPSKIPTNKSPQDLACK